ncbi:MAG: transposase [Pseudomonadota bacterium]
MPPSLIACSLILQQRYRLSDREMERQIRFNLATKYALGLPMDDGGFDHTVLCKFRGMLVENDQTAVCFDRFREALIQAGLIKAGETGVIDTTHVIADIAIPNTIELLRMGIKGVLRSAERLPGGVGNQLAKNLELGVVFEIAKRGEEKNHLVELVQAARRLLEYLEKSGDGFITAIEGMLGNRHDTWGVGEMMAELSCAGIKPASVVGDADEGLGMYLEGKGTKVVTPLKQRSESSVFANDMSELIQGQSGAPSMRCPGGEETSASYVTWRGRHYCAGITEFYV